MNELTVQTGMTGHFGELMKASEQFAKSSIVPLSFRGKPADVFVALQWGTELGMQPMSALQNIYVVNGRPTLSAQVMSGLVRGRQDYRGIDIVSNDTSAKCTVKRAIQGGTEEQTGEFTIEQARKAGLLSKDNWKNYPQQMLEARAIAFALRKSYPDVFAGIYSSEEVKDFSEETQEPKNITKEAEAKIEDGQEVKPEEKPPVDEALIKERAEKKAAFSSVYHRVIDNLTEKVKHEEDPEGWTKEERDAISLKDTIRKAKKEIDANLLECLDMKINFLSQYRGTEKWGVALPLVHACGDDLQKLKTLKNLVLPLETSLEVTAEVIENAETQTELDIF